MKKIKIEIFFVASLFLFCTIVNGQNSSQRIFKDFQDAFNKGDIALVAVHLSKETYISLFNGFSDYYSKGQAFYLLKEFVSSFAPMKLVIKHISENSPNPYAWGVLYYSSRGKNKSAKVFVSLTRTKGKLVISQLTIN